MMGGGPQGPAGPAPAKDQLYLNVCCCYPNASAARLLRKTHSGGQ